MKHILLIATGGTIASAEDGNGLSPALTGEELARSVPEIEGLCELDIVQPMNIDSTNMRPPTGFASPRSSANYDAHDGFVILHGTDTMSYTAAALSYLIQDSPKPIVLTGSQQPMGNPFTDAKINLYQSLVYAASDRSRDVSIVFGGYAIAGTRAREQHTMSSTRSTASTTPCWPTCARTRSSVAGRPPCTGPAECDCAGGGAARAADGALGGPRFYTELNGRVCALKLTPGLTPDIFRLLKPDYNAVILETFGIGGVPSGIPRRFLSGGYL